MAQVLFVGITLAGPAQVCAGPYVESDYWDVEYAECEAVDGNASGSSLNAAVSLTATGAVTAGAAASGAALAAGATITTSGTATGAVSATGASLVVGAAFAAGVGSGAAAAAGASLATGVQVTISGTATGGVAVPGALLTVGVSLAAGQASSAAAAAGAALDAGATLAAGTASASVIASAPGDALDTGVSLAPGIATGGISGSSLQVAATLVAGSASAGTEASGDTLAVATSLSGGTTTGAVQAPGAALQSSTSLAAGAPTVTATASGDSLTTGANLAPGGASATGEALGSALSAGTDLAAGQPGGAVNIVTSPLAVAVSLQEGSPEIDSTATGSSLAVGASLAPGLATAIIQSPGSDLLVGVVFAPGEAISGDVQAPTLFRPPQSPGPLDVSRDKRLRRQRYGSSDRTAPFFENPQYVKYNSLLKRYELGDVFNFDGRFEAPIGTVSGTNTLFLSFTTVMSTRFRALVLEPDGGYAASQLSFSLRHASGAIIPLDRTLLPDPSASVEVGFAPVSNSNSPYADFGYWDQGYTDSDDQPIVDLAPLEFSEPAEARLYAAYTAVDLPSGGYVLAISSRAWTETPLTLDLTLRASTLLSGEASSTTSANLRLSLARLFGEATGSDLTTGYVPRTVGVSGEATKLDLSTLAVTVTSPFIVTNPGLSLGQL